MPSLVKLYDEFKDSGLEILAIDVRESREVVQSFVRKAKLPFPVLLDSDGLVSSNFGITAHPAHFFVNRNGEVVALAMGARDWSSPDKFSFVHALIEKKTESATRSIK